MYCCDTPFTLCRNIAHLWVSIYGFSLCGNPCFDWPQPWFTVTDRRSWSKLMCFGNWRRWLRQWLLTALHRTVKNVLFFLVELHCVERCMSMFINFVIFSDWRGNRCHFKYFNLEIILFALQNHDRHALFLHVLIPVSRGRLIYLIACVLVIGQV